MFAYKLIDTLKCDPKSTEIWKYYDTGKGSSYLQKYSILKDDDPNRGIINPALDKEIGSFVGMVVGDALGASMEFKPIDYERKVNPWEIEGYFKLKPGQWTDDASMGFCLADSLICNNKLDPIDLMLRFEAWWHNGYNNAFYNDPSRNRSVGLGGSISMALDRFWITGLGQTDFGTLETSGNGSLMRNAAIPLKFISNYDEALQMAYVQSKTTHKGEEAAECCKLLTHIVLSYLGKNTKKFVTSMDSINNLLARGGWKSTHYRYEKNTNYAGSYCMDCMSMALHCVKSTSTFEEAMLKSANIGGDADSVTSVVGQIAGAKYGYSSIPKDWLNKIHLWDRNGDTELKAHYLLNAR